ANWEAIKLKEGKESVLDGLPAHLPALIKAQRMQEKAANVGFDWPEWRQVWGKLEEELSELKEVLEESDLEKSKEEFGDLLFSLVNVGRFFDLNAEGSLRLTNSKFIKRFRYIEKQVKHSDRSMDEVSLEEMDGFWEEAKTKA
ncbi:MAG: MazG nucleotide pyrophosphohydrolase domain-containing protein, partial [Candidatus Halalkalibacterium sp. M3_1C_030]